jgi:hypothetical protein
MRYAVAAASVLAGCICWADVLSAQEACVSAPNGAIVCGPIVQPNFGAPNYGPQPRRPNDAPRRNFEDRRDYDENERRDDRRGERPDVRRGEPPDVRRGEPPDVRRGEPPDMRRSDRPDERRGERPEERRPDEGRDRDRRGGPNPCARYGANFMLQDGECRPYIRR